MSKNKLIEEIRDLLNPRIGPEIIVFRSIAGGLYMHEGMELTREQCLKLPCRRMRIFVNRIKVDPWQARVN